MGSHPLQQGGQPVRVGRDLGSVLRPEQEAVPVAPAGQVQYGRLVPQQRVHEILRPGGRTGLHGHRLAVGSCVQGLFDRPQFLIELQTAQAWAGLHDQDGDRLGHGSR